LRLDVESMLRPSDTLTLPTFGEPDAWSRLWDIRVDLLDRRRAEYAAPENQAEVKKAAQWSQSQSDWNAFIQARGVLVAHMKRPEWRLVSELFDLSDSDVVKPLEQFEKDWQTLDGKVRSALAYLTNGAAYPISELRRRVQAKREGEWRSSIEKRLAEVERFLVEAKLHTRVSELELQSAASQEAARDKVVDLPKFLHN
jgi:hypothetical protein